MIDADHVAAPVVPPAGRAHDAGLRGHDLRALVRGGASDEELDEAIGTVWAVRGDRYSEIRSERTLDLPKVEMSAIGG